MCEQWQIHVDKVKFDQVNNVGMDGGDINRDNAVIVGGRFHDGGSPNEWDPR